MLNRLLTATWSKPSRPWAIATRASVREPDVSGGFARTATTLTTTLGGPLDVNNVRRDFRNALGSVSGIEPTEWTPRELRHSFVSLLSDAGVPLEEISRLVGHSGTTVTELVYRHQIRPVVDKGATVMDDIFG